jgi:hypothetical protein
MIYGLQVFDLSENAVWLVSMLSLRSMSGTLVELEVYVITVIIHLEFSPIKMTIYYRYGSLYIKKKFLDSIAYCSPRLYGIAYCS